MGNIRVDFRPQGIIPRDSALSLQLNRTPITPEIPEETPVAVDLVRLIVPDVVCEFGRYIATHVYISKIQIVDVLVTLTITDVITALPALRFAGGLGGSLSSSTTTIIKAGNFHSGSSPSTVTLSTGEVVSYLSPELFLETPGWDTTNYLVGLASSVSACKITAIADGFVSGVGVGSVLNGRGDHSYDIQNSLGWST